MYRTAACVFAVSLLGSVPAIADETPDVGAAMRRVERILISLGVAAEGYAQSRPPEVRLVPPDHPYVQGAEGGYAEGVVWLNEEARLACRDLVLAHELAHDATSRLRLFRGVKLAQLRWAGEALARSVEQAAAHEDPWRPGCLPPAGGLPGLEELAALARSEP